MATGVLNGIGPMYGPIMPVTKCMGRKARMTAMVAIIVGFPVSLVAAIIRRALSRRLPAPLCRWRWIFSMTTMASSTNKPSARIRAKRVIRLMVWSASRPIASTINRINGILSVTMAASRQPRNNNIMITIEMMATPRCSINMFTASSARLPESRVMVTRTLSGISSPLRVLSFFSIRRVTVTALVPRFLASVIETAGVSGSALAVFPEVRPVGPKPMRCSVVTSEGPSEMVAMSRR